MEKSNCYNHLDSRKILRHEQEARQGRARPLQEVPHPDGQSRRVS